MRRIAIRHFSLLNFFGQMAVGKRFFSKLKKNPPPILGVDYEARVMKSELYPQEQLVL